jgi:hypothetical protein
MDTVFTACLGTCPDNSFTHVDSRWIPGRLLVCNNDKERVRVTYCGESATLAVATPAQGGSGRKLESQALQIGKWTIQLGAAPQRVIACYVRGDLHPLTSRHSDNPKANLGRRESS